jgi:soluble lytic murein transglycosylase-like protein
VVSRGSLFVLGSLWLAACGAETKSVARPDPRLGALYDPTAEWSADRVLPPVLPPRPALAPSREPSSADWEAESDSGPRALSANQRARIADVQPIVHVAARAHAVPADLVNGIIWVESKFQVKARSKADACGLMQLMPSTGREVARQLGRSYHPYDPEFNIHAGTYYFARMIERFGGDLRLALAAYNTGPSMVEGWLRANRPLPDYSRAYVAHVFSAARAFRTYESQ